MATATAETIRDQIRLLIEYVDPVSDTGVRFRRYRAENGVKFRNAMEAAPAGALRRFHVRKMQSDEVPLVSNTDFARYEIEFEVVIAYPQTSRAGADGASDREDVIDQDWREIDLNIGITGRGNFGSTTDCVPLGCTHELEEGEGVDFLVITARYEYVRVHSQNGGLVLGLGAGLGG